MKMGRGLVREVNPKEVMLHNILSAMSTETFGKSLAAKLVGGESLLLELIADGKIECTKPTNKQNGKWFCNAAHVLQHCRNMRPTRKKSTNKPNNYDNN